MKVVINPKYSHLSDFIHEIPVQCYQKDTVIRDNRNILRKQTVDGCELVIKQYKKPLFFNRIVYSFFRKSKARRSFEYAFKLDEMNIGTAEPVAYIEEKKSGLFHTGYFISKLIPHPLMSSITEYDEITANEIMKDFIRFTVDTHEKGVIHYDYNLSNILFHKEDNHYKFDLIDINRMRFNSSSKRKCMRSLRTMGLQLPFFTAVTEHYAVLRGWNAEIFCGMLLMKRGLKGMRVKFKHRLKVALGLL